MVERAQRSVAEERLQIARELHDVVAHSLSVIAVQSGVGRHVIDEQPAEAKKALAAVEATSRSALDRVAADARGPATRRRADPAALAPAPGVAALDSLVERVRAAGFVVSLESTSTKTGTLSPSVQLSIYRIVQEALTNVVKHAGPATVRVEIRDETDGLVLEVSDDGRGHRLRPGRRRRGGGAGPPRDHRHARAGRAVRRVAVGGALSGGGFRVVASFPLDCLTSS